MRVRFRTSAHRGVRILVDIEKATWATIFPKGEHGGQESGPIDSFDDDDVYIVSDNDGTVISGPRSTATLDE